MNVWVQVTVYLLLYWTTLWIVPVEKLCKGLFTKHVLKRIIPPKRWWKKGTTGHSYRYWLWWITCILLDAFSGLAAATWGIVFWGPIIGLLLDDYIFGDDDAWKRRWEGVKNKIKWLMDLPPAPARQETV